MDDITIKGRDEDGHVLTYKYRSSHEAFVEALHGAKLVAKSLMKIKHTPIIEICQSRLIDIEK